MFWILRRTGAANFFNSLNNNCSSSRGSNNNGIQAKYVKRPPRKAYGRLSADSDDAVSMKHKTDDPFTDVDNFELFATGSGGARRSGNDTDRTAATIRNSCLLRSAVDADGNGDGDGDGDRDDVCSNDSSGIINGLRNVCLSNGGLVHCSATDCQGNCDDSGLCEFEVAALKANPSGAHLRGKEVNENTINRLQAMALSDDDEYDESLTCNVCDRAFHCHRQLASHQQKKRHFGCSGCDSLFPSLMLLEHHKEEFEHWSDDDISRRVCCRRNRGDDYFTDTDSFTSEAESEDLERLL